MFMMRSHLCSALNTPGRSGAKKEVTPGGRLTTLRGVRLATQNILRVETKLELGICRRQQRFYVFARLKFDQMPDQ